MDRIITYRYLFVNGPHFVIHRWISSSKYKSSFPFIVSMRSNFQELDIYLCNWMTWYWFILVYQVSRTCSQGDTSNQVKTTTRVYNVFRQSPMRFPSPTENFPIGLIEFLLLEITSGTKIWIFHGAWILKSK